ncbi:MAG: MFS transporter [Chlamydiia bacterium]|nr:MFS transporter [Chlamydiia bacterium]
MLKKINPTIITLVLLWVGHFLVDFMIGIWAIFKTLEGLDIGKAGLIAGISAFAGEGLQAYFGSLSDRGHTKKLILIGMIATTCAAFLPYGNSYEIYFLLFLLTCLGSGAFHPCAAGLIGKLSPARKGLFITLFASGGCAGIAVSQIVFRSAYASLGAQVGLIALPTLFLVLFILLNTIPDWNHRPAPSTKQRFVSEIFHFFKRRELTYLYILQVCSQSVFWGMIFLLPDILHTRQAPTWFAFGGGHLFYTLGMGLLLAPAGYLADRFSARQVLNTVFVIGTISLFTFLCFPTLPIHFQALVLFIFGGAIGAVNPVGVAYGTHLVPDKPGMISAFLMGMVWCVAEVIGPAGGGMLTRLFTTDAPAYAMGILGLLLLIGFAMSVLLPQEKKELKLGVA